MSTSVEAPARKVSAPQEEILPGQSRTRRLLSRTGVQIVLVIIALFWLIPGIGLFITSLRPVPTYGVSGWWRVFTAPAELTLENYRSFIDDPNVIDSVTNTILIAVPSTILPLIIAALAGYAFAWIPFKGRDVLFLVIVGLLVVPLQMGLIPALQIFNFFGITGIPAVVIYHTAFGLPFAVFLMASYFSGLPASLMEASRIDGAGEWTIFRRVVLPLGAPALAALAIFQFTWTWNDLLVALVFAGNNPPLTVAIQNRLGEFSSGIGTIAPGVFLASLVPLIIFFAFQRYFEAGLLGGSVK